MKIKHISKILIILIVLAFTGCLSMPPAPTQVYSGPKLPREEVAVVTMDSSLGVVTVNNIDPDPYADIRTFTLELLPGKYRIILFYNSGYEESINDQYVILLAEAGKSYHIYDGAGGGSWLPYIEQKY